MPPLTLTHVEAQERAALLDIESYDIAVDLTDLPAGPAVRAISQVTFTCREPGASSFVDCAADVVVAELNGTTLPEPVDGRIALPELAAHNVLRVESVQTSTTQGDGVRRVVDPGDDEVYVWMSFEPDGARYVWACFDQPDLKAPHTFTVTAPAAWTVTSNSGGPTIEDAGDARRWSFPATPPLATYNTVINAGPFHEIRREVGGYDLGLFSRRTLAHVLERDADELFRVTAQGLEFFGDAFTMPFPQRTYDQVFAPQMQGAMENFGCVTWSDNFLTRSAPTPAERELTAKVLLHEMAHMWFGNIVTMRWWDDLWLNEAYAEFACHWAATQATEYTDAWAGHLAVGKVAAYLADQGPTSHPIRRPIADVGEAMSIFDAITYPKGASVLAQLMTYVGEADFRTGMSAYFARHAWGNTTLQDLVDALASASGRDLDTWRTLWLETAGTDRLTLERGDDGLTLVARSPQGPARPHVLAVSAFDLGDEGLRRRERALVELAGDRTPVDLPLDADVYLVNDDDLTFATTRPDETTRDAFVAHAGAFPSALSRGVAVATVWDMLLGGEATAAEAVGVMTAVLRAETSDTVVEPYLARALEAAEAWSSDDERAELLEQVCATARELADHPARRRPAMRVVARTAGDLAAVASLQDEAGDDVDLQWRLLVRTAELGGAVEDDVAALLARDPDPDRRLRAVAVRAAAPDAAAKVATWDAIVGGDVPVNALRDVATAFWRPGQDAVLGAFVDRYVDLVPTFARGGMIASGARTAQLFPLYGADDDALRRCEQAAEGTAPVVATTVLARADLVRRMLRSRAAQPTSRAEK